MKTDEELIDEIVKATSELYPLDYVVNKKSDWIEYSKQKPEEGKDLWYFFDIVGVHKGQYYGDWLFASDKGFLQCDVTHWQYDVGQDRPDRPEGFK